MRSNRWKRAGNNQWRQLGVFYREWCSSQIYHFICFKLITGVVLLSPGVGSTPWEVKQVAQGNRVGSWASRPSPLLPSSESFSYHSAIAVLTIRLGFLERETSFPIKWETFSFAPWGRSVAWVVAQNSIGNFMILLSPGFAVLQASVNQLTFHCSLSERYRCLFSFLGVNVLCCLFILLK